jgi:hypothetical protein
MVNFTKKITKERQMHIKSKIVWIEMHTAVVPIWLTEWWSRDFAIVIVLITAMMDVEAING